MQRRPSNEFCTDEGDTRCDFRNALSAKETHSAFECTLRAIDRVIVIRGCATFLLSLFVSGFQDIFTWKQRKSVQISSTDKSVVDATILPRIFSNFYFNITSRYIYIFTVILYLHKFFFRLCAIIFKIIYTIYKFQIFLNGYTSTRVNRKLFLK